MSETVSLDWIGSTLRTIQAEQRTIRDENKLIRVTINELTTALVNRLAASEETMLNRIAAFEAHLDTRIDIISLRIDSLHKVIERLEAKLDTP